MSDNKPRVLSVSLVVLVDAGEDLTGENISKAVPENPDLSNWILLDHYITEKGLEMIKEAFLDPNLVVKTAKFDWGIGQRQKFEYRFLEDSMGALITMKMHNAYSNGEKCLRVILEGEEEEVNEEDGELRLPEDLYKDCISFLKERMGVWIENIDTGEIRGIWTIKKDEIEVGIQSDDKDPHIKLSWPQTEEE